MTPISAGLLGFLLLIYPIIHFAWGLGMVWGLARYGGFPLRLRGLLRSERLVQRGTPDDAEAR